MARSANLRAASASANTVSETNNCGRTSAPAGVRVASACPEDTACEPIIGSISSIRRLISSSVASCRSFCPGCITASTPACTRMLLVNDGALAGVEGGSICPLH